MIILTELKRGYSKGTIFSHEWRIPVDKIIGYYGLESPNHYGGNTFVFLDRHEMYVKETVEEIDSLLKKSFKLKIEGARNDNA